MELLLILIGEFLLALLLSALAVIGSVLGGVGVFLLDMVTDLFGSSTRRNRESEPTPQQQAGVRRRKRLTRRVAIGFAGVAAVVVVALAIVNFLFLAPAVRHVFGTIEERTGYAVNCAEITGNLMAGELALKDCRAARDRGPDDRLDLTIETLAFNVELLSLLGSVDLVDCSATGVSGQIARPSQEAQRKKSRRPFEIEKLALRDVRLDLSGYNRDGQRFDLPVRIETLDSAPFRSRLAIFDLLFRSNGRGSIAGGQFDISSAVLGEGRRTRWQASDIPVASLGGVAGGALGWLYSGNVDVQVEDRWQRGPYSEIELDWKLDFQGVKVSPPDDTGTVTRFLTKPMVRYVNDRDGAFPLHFQMVLNADNFESAASLEATGFWLAFGESVERTWSTLLGLKTDDEPSSP